MLRVACEVRDAAAASLHFVVQDTGIGIPPEKQKSIFDAFSQADSSTTRKFGGTGLGLAICYRLVQLMNGEIWVTSEVGQGSEFHFRINVGLSEPSERFSPMELQDLAGVSVLIVERHATSRRVLTDILARWGTKAVAVETSEQALSALRHAAVTGDAFTSVLTAARLPDTDGFRLVEQIQESFDSPPTAILMLPCCGQHADIARCRQIGIAAHLTKPIRQHELREALRQARDKVSELRALQHVAKVHAAYA